MTRLEVRTERHLVNARRGGSRHAVVSIGAPRLEGARERAPMNLAFVLDRSGSMTGDKLALAKGATAEALQRLSRRDRFAVVTYDDEVQVTVPSVLADRGAREEAVRRLSEVRSGGSTALCDGWLTGCREIAQHLGDGQVARALLFTDGLANHGETDPDVLAHHAAELRARGIATSTLGIGADFDEHLLRRLADAGGGNARFIESPADFARLVDAELRDTLDIVHRGLTLRLSGPDTASIEPVGPWPATRVGQDIHIALGDVVSEEELEVVVRAEVRPGVPGETLTIGFSLFDRDGEVDAARASVTWTWATAAENSAQPRDIAVDRVVAARHAARGREQAVLANRRNDLGDAERLLRRVAERIRRYAGDDPELLAIVAQLQADAERYGRPMERMDQKRAYYASSSVARGKDVDGSARRR